MFFLLLSCKENMKENIKENSLISIEITPVEQTLYPTDTQQYTAIGTYKDHSTQDLTATAIWYSSDPNIAIISPLTGLATALHVGTTQITAILGNVRSNNVNLNIQKQETPPTPPKIVKIEISASNADILINDKQNFTATAVYSDQSTENVASKVKWNSSIPTVATIAEDGKALGVSPGTTQISATIDSISSNKISLNVNIKYFSLLESSIADVTIGPDGNIWYIQSSRTEPSDNNIIRQTLDGKITKFPVNPKTITDIPRFIVSALDGNLWFNIGSKMIKMTLSGTKTEYSIGFLPTSISMSADGRLILASTANLIGLSLDGTITKYIQNVIGSDPKTTTDHLGNIWFIIGGRSSISKLKPGATPLIIEYPLPGWSTIPHSSSAMVYGADGNIWFTENENKIAKITSEGIITEYQIPNSSAANSIVSDSKSFIWFVANNKIVSVNMSGIFKEYPIDTTAIKAISIEHGKLWFTTNNNKIGMFILPTEIH